MHLSVVAANMPCLKIFLEGMVYNELYISLATLTAV
jgi:hypothetical protein